MPFIHRKTGSGTDGGEPGSLGRLVRGGAGLLTSAFGVGVAARIVVQVLAFAQIMVAARFIDLAGFGTYALGWAVCVIAVSFVYTGFYQALLRSTDFEAARDTGFWAMAMIGGGGSVIMAAVGLVLPGAAPGTAMVFLGLAPVPVIRALVAWNEAHLVRDRRVRLVSVYGLLSEAAAFAVLWAALAGGMGLFALVLGRYAALVVEGGIALAACRVLPGAGFSARHLRTLRATALPLWGTSALGMFSNYGADLILGAFLNTSAVGAYRSASRISQTAADLIFQPLNTITWSRMSQLEKAGERDGFAAVWFANTGFGAFVLWPVLAAIGALAGWLVAVLFDESWLAAAPVIVILCASRAVAHFATLLEPTVVCRGRDDLQVKVRGAAAVASLAGLLAFGRWGASEAALAHVLASCVAAGLGLRAIHATVGLSARGVIRAHAPAALLSLVCLAGLIAGRPLLEGFGPVGGLVVAGIALTLVWLAGVGIALRHGFVVLPRP